MSDFAAQRAHMVERQLRDRGIEDERVLAAMGEAPREEFVGERRREMAYADAALPIGSEQTISQPWIVAAILQALELRGDERVLEIGTGSGYSTYLLGRLAAHVVSVERHAGLARLAAAPAPPPALLEQLADGGRMVVPVASGREEMLTALRRHGTELESVALAPCRFVPLIGAEGF
jgi:protein-L-isoaspartate(D-aspartate) O-methyltransferase